MSSLENQQQKIIAFDASSNRVSFVINAPAKRKTFSTSKNEPPVKKPCQCLELKGTQTTAGGLKCSLHGIIFQLHLLTLVLYRASHHDNEDFGLATEIPDAEKFDDIVFVRERDGRKQARLIQAKHSEGKIKEISQADLLSKKSKDPFSMLKYFESYLKIRENCKNCESDLYNCEIEDIMIVTNRSISNDLQKHVKGEKIQDRTSENLLYTPQHVHDKARKYSIEKGQFYDKLAKMFIESGKVKDNEETKDIESKAENAVDEFFKKFRLIVDYPNRTTLEKMLEDELQEEYKILDSGAILDILRNEMYKWLSDQKAGAFNFKSARDLFAGIEEKISCYEINGITKFNLESIPDQYYFQNDELPGQIKEFLISERILLALEFDTLGLGRMRIDQTFKQLKQLITAKQQENNERHSENDGQRLENDERSLKKLKSYVYQFGHIFINSEQSQNCDFHEYVEKCFSDERKWNLIIIELDDIQQNPYFSVIEYNTKLDKKVIVITSKKRQKMLPSQIQKNILRIETNFMHLKPDSQKRLFETETALFKKTNQPLNKLLCQQNKNVIDATALQTIAGGLGYSQHDTIFQLDLLTLVLYRANYHEYEDFWLAIEIHDAEKFDDIVFIREKDGRKQARLIQAKHSEGKIKEISKADLLSKYSKDPFCMRKYFESYLKIEENCKNCESDLYNCEIEDILIVTNRSISNDLQEHAKGETIQNDNLLCTTLHGHDKAQKYSIQKGQLYDRLTKIFIERYKDIEKQKVKENEEANDKESKAKNAVDEFFEKFRLVVDYPNRTALEKMLKDELQEVYKILDSRAKLDILRIEMNEWLSDQKAGAFNFKSARELFARIEEEISCYEIYGITKSNLESIPVQYHFENDELLEQIKEFLNSERILLALEFNTLGLGRIRTTQTFKQLKQLKTAKQLENNERNSETDGQRLENDERSLEKLKPYIYQFGHIFINSEQSQNRDFYEYLQKRLRDKGKWNLIIIELDDIQQDLYSPVIEYISKLDKKVILIISKKRKKMLSSQVQNNILKIETNFMHLKPDSQKRLFETETVLFQKTSQPLNRLLCQQNQNVIDATALDRFIYKKQVRIGTPFVYKAYVETYNIERHLNRKICIQNGIKKHLFRASFTKNIFYFPFRPNKNNSSDVIVISRIREDFENAAETIECENIHWLQEIDGKLIWAQTKGNVSKLAAYRSSDTSNLAESSIIEESSLIQGTEKIVIISGQHGTGKSTLFGSLEKKLKQTNGLIWTIRIDLQHYSSFLIDKSKKTQIPDANIQTWAIDLLIELLQSNDSTNQFTPLEEGFFRSLLERQKTDSGGTGLVRIALFIDEISEINLICQEIVLDMLVELKSTAVYRIFILTRPTTQSMLEVKLGTFAYNIEPFSESNQIDFFKARQLNDKNIDKRCNYTVP